MTPTTIFTTSLTTQSDLIQIWGQKERNTVQMIDQVLLEYGDVYTRTSRPDLRQIVTNLKCIAYNVNGKFYRASVISIIEDNLLSVHSMDYGFDFFADIRNIRIPSPAEPIMTHPPQAEGYFIAGVAITPKTPVEVLKTDVLSQLFTVQVVSDLGLNFRIARFYRGPLDITNVWLERAYVKSIPQRTQEQTVVNTFSWRQKPAPEPSGSRSTLTATAMPFPPPTTTQPPANLLKNPSLIKALAAEVKEQIGLTAEPGEVALTSSPPPAPSQYTMIPIPLGATFSISVTAIADGPWAFSVQLKSDIPLLNEIKKELQMVSKVPLKPPVALGKPCIAFNPALMAFCRGVIVGITHSSIRISFVDYGTTEEVPLKSIFEPPLSVFKTKVLAHNFSLAQISKMKITQDEVPDLNKAFKEVVADDEFMRLQVSPAEENCMQTCDLFVGNQNVKLLLNQRMQTRRRYLMEPFPKVGESVSVYVTHVEGVHKFFIQLRKREDEINKFSEELQAVSRVSPLLKETDLRPGMPCLGQFLEDMQWYRGKIISISEESVSVIFVDYGNDMTARPSVLKQIPPEFVKRLPAQALLCELAGVPPSDADVFKNLLNIINEDGITMVVKAVEKNKASVALSKAGVDLVSLSAAAKVPPPQPVPNYEVGIAPTQRRFANDVSPPARFGGDSSKPKTEVVDDWVYPSDQRHQRENWRKRERQDDYDRRNRRFSSSDHRRTDKFANRSPRNQVATEENGEGPRRFGGKGFQRDSDHTEDKGSRFGGGFKRRDAEDGEDSGGRFGDRGGFKRRDNGAEDGGSKFGGKSFNRRDGEEGDESGGRFGDRGGFKRRDNGTEDGGSKFGGKSFNQRDGEDGKSGDRGGFKSFNRRDGEEGDDSGGRFGGKSGGFQKRDNEDGGGFKGFQKRDNEDGGGFKKSFRSNDEGSGDFKKPFKTFNSDDGASQDDRPRRMPIRNEDRAPPGSKFTEPSFDPDTTIEGIVTFFASPASFFVQIQADVAKFSELMQNVQQDYVNKFSLRETDPLEEGDIVVAKFSEDRVLYRAEVLTSDPLSVRFVDYGNFENVRNRRDVYPVLRKLLDLPTQALHCSLDGVKPIGESWTPESARVFQQENMSFKLLSENDRVWQVSASCDGKDLAEQLISEGLATSSAEVVQAEAVLSETPEDKIFRIDCDLLPGELLVADIPYIYSVDKFYAQFHSESVETLQTVISEQLAEPVARVALEVSAVAPGTLCIASTLDEPDVLYRAKVVQLIETGALVQFIDYGDLAEVPFTQIFEIGEELAAWPDLAIECSLQGDFTALSDESQDEFKTELEGGQGIILVHEVDRSCDYPRLKVTLYDLTGKKQKVQEGVNDSPAECALPTVPLIASPMVLNILDFTSPSRVLLQLPKGEDLIIDEPEAGEVEDGTPSAVLCADSCWRRALVTEGNAFLVDTGYVEPVTDIRPLPPTLRGLPCVVRDVAASFPALGIVKVAVKREDSGLVIEPAVKTGFISHVETATQVYFTPESVSERLDEIQETISSSVAAASEEELVVAKFPDDGLWYRAQVIEREPLKVRFLDYGNSTLVEEIAPLSADLTVVPPLAVRIDLSTELPESAKEQLEELIAAAETPLTLVEVEGRAIDFLLNGRSVIAQLKGQPELFPGSNVVVSHIVDATELYLQREVDTQVLTEIEERLTQVESLQVVTGPTDAMVAAEFEDGAWYRARYQNDQLYFVDFGNMAEPGEVRLLPADLAAIPPMAIRVGLMPPENTEDPLQLSPGGPLLTDLLNVPLRLLEVTSTDGVTSVRLTEVPTPQARARAAPRDTRDQTDDDKSAGMSRNETDEEKRGKMQALLNVPDSDLEAAAQLDEEAPLLEFELPEDDQPRAAHQTAEVVMSPTTSLPDDALSQQGEEMRGMSDEALIASGEVLTSTSLSDEDLLQRDENLASQDSVPDDERITTEEFSRLLVNETVSAMVTNEVDDVEVPDEEQESCVPVSQVDSDVSPEINESAVSASLSDEALLERYESIAQDAMDDSHNTSSEEIAKSLGIEDVGNTEYNVDVEVTEQPPSEVTSQSSESVAADDVSSQAVPTEEYHSFDSDEGTYQKEETPADGTVIVTEDVLNESFSSVDFNSEPIESQIHNAILAVDKSLDDTVPTEETKEEARKSIKLPGIAVEDSNSEEIVIEFEEGLEVVAEEPIEEARAESIASLERDKEENDLEGDKNDSETAEAAIKDSVVIETTEIEVCSEEGKIELDAEISDISSEVVTVRTEETKEEVRKSMKLPGIAVEDSNGEEMEYKEGLDVVVEEPNEETLAESVVSLEQDKTEELNIEGDKNDSEIAEAIKDSAEIETTNIEVCGKEGKIEQDTKISDTSSEVVTSKSVEESDRVVDDETLTAKETEEVTPVEKGEKLAKSEPKSVIEFLKENLAKAAESSQESVSHLNNGSVSKSSDGCSEANETVSSCDLSVETVEVVTEQVKKPLAATKSSGSSDEGPKSSKKNKKKKKSGK